MKRSSIKLLAKISLAGVVLAAGITTAQARPKFSTSYQYYRVSGSSAASIHSNTHVPTGFFSSERAYANITMNPKVVASLNPGKRYCRFNRLSLGAHFTVRLPKLAKGAGGNRSLRRKFASFVKFAKRHELTHRRIWIKCFSRSERKIRALRIKSCRSLDQAGAKIIERELATCKRNNARFDAVESRRVRRQAFVRAAIKQVKTPRRRSISKRRTTRSRTRTNFN